MVEESKENQGGNLSPDDEISSLATGYAWAMRISSIGFEMAVPALIGIWLDRKFDTVVVFLILGAVLGAVVGFLHILQIARDGK